jgi:hypothetical protein
MKLHQDNINPYSKLPPNIAIPSAGSHMYMMGISLFRFGQERRISFYNPIFVLTINVVYVARCLTALFTPERYTDMFIYLGDCPYFINSKIHLNIAGSQYIILSIISQLINFWMYHKKIYPTYFRPFLMMSGSIAPKSIGFTSRPYLRKLLKRSKIVFSMTQLNNIAVLFVSFFISYLPIMMKLDIKLSIIFGVPWSIMFAMSSHFTFGSHSWHLTYFYVMCLYLRLKIRNINDQIQKYIVRRNFGDLNIDHVLQSLTSIHMEIGDYNKRYWSNFSFTLLVFYVTSMNIVLYIIIFKEIAIIVKICLFYAFLLCLIVIIFYLQAASAVSHEAIQSYKLLNKLSIACTGNKRVNVSKRIKVSVFYNKK